MSTECLRCGVCCFSTLETYVRVSGSDWSRLGSDADAWAHFIGNRAYLRMEEGHCRALEKHRLDAQTTEYFCRIYERRPDICRGLDRGSAECEGERLRKLTAAGGS